MRPKPKVAVYYVEQYKCLDGVWRDLLTGRKLAQVQRVFRSEQKNGLAVRLLRRVVSEKVIAQ